VWLADPRPKSRMRHPAVDFSKQGPLVLTNKRALLSKAHAQTGVLETTDLRRRVKQRELPCTDGEPILGGF